MPNPKLRRVPRKSLPEHMARAHDESMAIRGDATFFEIFGNHPRLYDWYSQRFYGEVFNDGLLDRRVKELVRYRLSTLHGCKFCNQGNRLDALDSGLSEWELESVEKDDYSVFDDPERAALMLAQRLSLSSEDARLDGPLYDLLASQFSDAEILELGMVIGILSGMARFLFAFDLVEREDSCPFH